MPDDFAHDPHFINVTADLGTDGMGVLSRNALNLHLHGCLNSIADGHPWIRQRRIPERHPRGNHDLRRRA